MKRMKLLFTLALPVLLLQNAHAQMSRLIGKADWYSNGVAFAGLDTSAYSYSDGRGGDLTHAMKYDNAMTWLNTDTSLANSTLVTQVFNSDNTIQSQTTQTWNAFSSIWNNTSKNNYFYSGGVLSNMIYQTWGGSSWTNVSEDTYGYDGYGKLSSDLFGNWVGLYFDTASEKLYYNGSYGVTQLTNLNYSAGTWTNVSQYNYSYNSLGWLGSYTYSTWNGGGFTPQYIYTNTYDSATGDKLTQTYQTYSMGAPVNVSLNTYGGFVTGTTLPTTEIVQNWDTASGGSYVNSKSWTFSYNSFNQMTESLGESWNAAGFWEFALGDPESNYYYETYTPSTSVNNVANANGNVNIYPNPSQNTININLTWNEAQPFTVSVFDMRGALVNAWKVASTAQYKTSFSVDTYAPGNYVIRITGTDGTITRSVVVAH